MTEEGTVRIEYEMNVLLQLSNSKLIGKSRASQRETSVNKCLYPTDGKHALQWKKAFQTFAALAFSIC